MKSNGRGNTVSHRSLRECQKYTQDLQHLYSRSLCDRTGRRLYFDWSINRLHVRSQMSDTGGTLFAAFVVLVSTVVVIAPSCCRIQPNAETRKKQLDAWRTLLLDYCHTRKVCVIDVREGDSLPVFNNPTISSRCCDQYTNLPCLFVCFR